MLLFAYGTLLPGHAPDCVADFVSRLQPIGPATIRGTLFSFGSYPGVVLNELGIAISGFLFELPADDPTLLRRLDVYEGFDPAAPATSLFRRVSTTATLEDGRA